MSAIALLPRVHRRQMSVSGPGSGPTPTPTDGMSAAGSAGCSWRRLVPALAVLGPVLHVDSAPSGNHPEMMENAPWPAQADLIGMTCATRVVASVLIDSNGPRECLHFLDDKDVPLASIWLLPDSDFLAWEQLVSRVSRAPVADLAWWRELPPHALRGVARVRRFAWVTSGGNDVIEAFTPPGLSCIGQHRAGQIAAATGARFSDVFV